MANKAQRRFVELSVGEVSLVDSPANEEEFAVIKSLNAMEENEMPDEKKAETIVEDEVKKEDDKAEKAEVEKVDIEVDKPEDDNVKKAMEKVVSTVEAIAKSVGIGAEEKAEKDAEEEVKEEEVETEKEKPEDAEEKTEKAETGKASLLEQLSAEIEKAKRFTPNRAGALKSAIETLSKLAEELGDQPQKKATAPGTASFGESGIKEIMKSVAELTDTFKSSFSEVSEVTKQLADRVETIEKERKPSKSLSDEGGTDTKVKTEKGLWSGVL